MIDILGDSVSNKQLKDVRLKLLYIKLFTLKKSLTNLHMNQETSNELNFQEKRSFPIILFIFEYFCYKGEDI